MIIMDKEEKRMYASMFAGMKLKNEIIYTLRRGVMVGSDVIIDGEIVVMRDGKEVVLKGERLECIDGLWCVVE